MIMDNKNGKGKKIIVAVVVLIVIICAVVAGIFALKSNEQNTIGAGEYTPEVLSERINKNSEDCRLEFVEIEPCDDGKYENYTYACYVEQEGEEKLVTCNFIVNKDGFVEVVGVSAYKDDGSLCLIKAITDIVTVLDNNVPGGDTNDFSLNLFTGYATDRNVAFENRNYNVKKDDNIITFVFKTEKY